MAVAPPAGRNMTEPPPTRCRLLALHQKIPAALTTGEVGVSWAVASEVAAPPALGIRSTSPVSPLVT